MDSDPWWIFTTVWLVKTIKTEYDIPFVTLFQRGPRFGMLLTSMFLSLVFIVVDVCSSVIPHFSSTVGINPYWKFALIFKCFCDTIILDDFKTALEKLRRGVFETYETVRYDDGEDTGLGNSRRGGVDRGGNRPERPRTMSIPVSPTATREFRKKSYSFPKFGSTSPSKGQSDHLETATSVEQSSSSSRPSNEAEKKEGIELESQTTRGSRRPANQAREAVGKVGTKLAQLPSLGSNIITNSRRKQSPQSGKRTGVDSDMPVSSDPPLDRSNDHRFARSETVSRPQRSIPDPHHIPTDEELDADPTGRRNFEERRRVQVSRDETDRTNHALLPTDTPAGGNVPFEAHPGMPWGLNYEGDEPWGVNQVATVRATGGPDPSSGAEPELGTFKSGTDPEEEKIDFRDAL